MDIRIVTNLTVNISNCQNQNLPEYQLIKIGKTCLNVTTDNTTETECPDGIHLTNDMVRTYYSPTGQTTNHLHK